MGLLGIVVGLYLRGLTGFAGEDTARALPYFINQSFPAPLAGLLVIVLGTGAGLVLGVTTNLHNDLLARIGWIRRRWDSMVLLRAGCVGIVLTAPTLTWLSLHMAILEWSYVAMGLRGTAIFTGLCLVVFFKRAPWVHRAKPVLFALPVVYPLYLNLS